MFGNLKYWQSSADGHMPIGSRRSGLHVQLRACASGAWLVERYGTSTVELDAIPAREVRRIVRVAIESHMEPAQLRTLQMVEREERESIRVLLGNSG